MALHGSDHNDGPFYIIIIIINLVFEMVRGNLEQEMWLKKRDNFMSYTIQNEIIELISHEIQRELVKDAADSTFVGITADGISAKKQFSLCMRYLDKYLHSHCVFTAFITHLIALGRHWRQV